MISLTRAELWRVISKELEECTATDQHGRKWFVSLILINHRDPMPGKRVSWDVLVWPSWRDIEPTHSTRVGWGHMAPHVRRRRAEQFIRNLQPLEQA